MQSDDTATLLELTQVVTAPALTAALRALAPAPGSRGLDVGCGIGTHTLLLAEAVGPKGRVTGLDISADMLVRARRAADDEAATAPRPPLEFVQGDISALPFDDACLDWLWCADTLWPGMVVDDPVPVVRELARVLRPGGTLALLYWSGQRLLPGHPALEARLDEAFAAAVPYMGAPPEHHFSRAVGWLRAAGLRDAAARTFVADHSAPLGPRAHQALAACFAMLWGELVDRLAPADREDFERLCRPGSPGFILDEPGYAASISYTMYVATVPMRGPVLSSSATRGRL